MAQLEVYLHSPGITDAMILRHLLGRERLPDAPPSADNMIVIGFDTESWVWDSEKLTEIGFCIFDSRELRQIKEAGPHGQNLLKGMYWYHVRIQPNCHLVNRASFLRGNPNTNRFGTTRFLTIPETKDMLTECFGWEIDPSRPELGNCPVVVLGHALHNDLPKLHEHVGFDHRQLGTVVKQIDTQHLAASTGHWSGQPVGLRRLVKNIIGFEYRDEHTACNDIGMTVISAVQMVLPTELKTNQPKTLQEVVDSIEEWSQGTPWSNGSATYCLQCNTRGHMKKRCRASIDPCEHCSSSGVESRMQAAPYHESHKCITWMKEMAKDDRARLAMVAREALSINE